MSIIIIEGPDRCGKSTQVKKIHSFLADSGPTHIIKCSNIPNKSNEQARKLSEIYYRDMFSLCQWAHNRDSNLIIDRSWIGETVYSPIYRNYNGDYVFDIEKEFFRESWWNNLNLITFVDEPKNLIKREDGLSFSIDISIKHKEVIAFQYAHVMSNIKHKKLINIDGLDVEKVWEKVYNFLCWPELGEKNVSNKS